MPGSTAISSSFVPSSSNPKKRGHREVEVEVDAEQIPDSSTGGPQAVPSGLNSDLTYNQKKQRVGPSTSTIPRTLPMQPHEELLQELKGKYNIATTSVISSSKINKKVTSVLSHLGQVDLFNPQSRPGVMMLHARDKDASKMVTVMELAKRRMTEAAQPWFQYNRIYQIAEEPKARISKLSNRGKGVNQTVINDTILGGNEDEVEDEEDAFEPVENSFEQAVRDKPAVESKSTYMSMFLSRVPIPELQAKAFISLQTNAGELGRQPKT